MIRTLGILLLITFFIVSAEFDALSAQSSQSDSEDAGLWLKADQKEDQDPKPCPQKFYLGGRGTSYASGVTRTAAMQSFVDSRPRAIRIGKSEIIFEATLKFAFRKCRVTARSDTSGFRAPFHGELYIFNMEKGKLTFKAHAGDSLSILGAHIFQNQIIFKIAENL